MNELSFATTWTFLLRRVRLLSVMSSIAALFVISAMVNLYISLSALAEPRLLLAAPLVRAAAIATSGDATEHFRTDTFVTDDSAANSDLFNAGGLIFMGAIPLEGPAYERYVGILAVTATTTTTAGTVNAFLTLDPGGWTSYADATN